LERLFAFLDLVLNEFKHLVKGCQNIAINTTANNPHLFNDWVKNFATEEIPRDRDISVDESNLCVVRVLNIEAVEVEELICVN
jgi:hypothetical protein